MGINLLAADGELSFITNNKWLRSGYGIGLRTYLLESNLELISLIDFGDLPVFPEATTYPNILSVGKRPALPTIEVAELTTLGTDPNDFPRTVKAALSEMSTSRLSSAAWSLAPVEHQDLIQKLGKAGVTLGNYVSEGIYYGIKTGYNQAFVVDEATRGALISNDINLEKVIKPFIAGRDVKRYQIPSTKNYLLYIPWDFPIEEYSALKQHLQKYFLELSARPDVKAKRYPWYALSRYAPEYVLEYEKPKIILPEIASRNHFTLDSNNVYGDTTTFIVSSSDPYLLGVLNSSAVYFFFKNISSEVRGGYSRWKRQYLINIPIPPATPAQQAEIAALVEQVLAAKAAGEPTATLEAAIDDLVAARYGLSPAEVAQLGD